MTNLISDAFIQAKELVMKAMGELVADGIFLNLWKKGA